MFPEELLFSYLFQLCTKTATPTKYSGTSVDIEWNNIRMLVHKHVPMYMWKKLNFENTV